MNETLVATTVPFPIEPEDHEGMVVMDNSTSSVPGNSSVSDGFPWFIFQPTNLSMAQAYVYIVCVVVGVFTNCLNLVVLHRMPRKPVFIYLKGLALTDMMFGISMAMLIAYIWNETPPSYTYCFIHCHIVAQLLWACAKVSSSITVAIGVERIVSTLFPLKALKLASTRRVWVTIFIIVVLCLGAQAGLAIMVNPIPYDDVYLCVWSPTTFTPLGHTILLVNAIIFDYTVPLILLACNLCLIVTLAVHKARRRSLFASQSHSHGNQVDHKMNALLIAMSVLTLVGNTPTTLIRLVEIPESIFRVVRIMSNILFILDRVANFFLYCLVNAHFRAIAKDILFCGKSSPTTDSNYTGKTNSNENVSASKTPSSRLEHSHRSNSSHGTETNYMWDVTKTNNKWGTYWQHLAPASIDIGVKCCQSAGQLTFIDAQ